MKTYILNILIAADQFATAVFGGWPDETLSSYAYRLHVRGKPFGRLRPAINALFFWQDDHCRDAYEAEVRRDQLPKELRWLP